MVNTLPKEFSANSIGEEMLGYFILIIEHTQLVAIPIFLVKLPFVRTIPLFRNHKKKLVISLDAKLSENPL